MTAATWILAIATTALAAEGGTAVWKYLRIRPGCTRRELQAIHREITLLQHATWLSVSASGNASEVADKVRNMLFLDGWRPDTQLAEQAGQYNLSGIQEDPGGWT